MLHALNIYIVMCERRTKKSLPQEAHKYFFSVYSFSSFILSPIQLAMTLNAEHAMLLGPILLITYCGSTHTSMHAHWYSNYTANASYLQCYIPINADKCVHSHRSYRRNSKMGSLISTHKYFFHIYLLFFLCVWQKTPTNSWIKFMCLWACTFILFLSFMHACSDNEHSSNNKL